MKNMILYNPLAGHGDGRETAEALVISLFPDATAIDMTTITDYTAFFAPLTEDDSVILCGGDGTLNRFINEIEGVRIRCDILYHASGSGNDFLRDLQKSNTQLPFSISNYLRDLPTVEIAGKQYRFLNNVGFGIDGYCCEEGDRLRARGKETINYTMIAIKGLLRHYRPTNATVTVDGESFRFENVWIAPTMKGRYYGGGMMPTPEQDRSNPTGELSVMIFHGKSKLKTLMIFPSIFSGKHVKHTDCVSVFSGQEISVRFDEPRAAQIDGETVTGVTEYRAYAHARVKLGRE